MEKKGCPYGTHRVISPKNVLPQTADRVDNRLPIYSNEILVEVDTLNVDAASFRQIKESNNHDLKAIADTIMNIVGTRGKQQNPVTGSGGMLLGKVLEIGKRGLYLGGEWGSCIDGLPADEAQALYEELLQHMIQDRFSYQHRWQAGDVLMSDNRCSLHRASEWDEETQLRRLHRIITIDDRAPY